MMRTGLIFTAAAIAVMAGAYMWANGAIPANAGDLPVHWGVNGPDRFAPRDEAMRYLLLMPAISLFVSLLMAAAPQIDPFRENILKGRRAYLTAWIGAQALLALAAVGVAVMMVRHAQGGGGHNEFVRFIIAGVGVLFIFLGDAMPKTRPNFFVGVRTPWTLTSDLAWQKTHRLAGWLFVLTGFWAIVAAFTLKGLPLALSVAVPAIAVALISAIYSWAVWKDDPDKRTTMAR